MPQPTSAAKAIANNDVVYLHWQYPAKLAGCLGFSIHRIDLATNRESPLPTWVGFKSAPAAPATPGDKGRPVQNSDTWPIQKFSWKDVTAPRGGHLQYRVIPMFPTAPGVLTLKPDLAQSVLTGDVHLTPAHGDLQVYFNRGIISTQAISGALPLGPDGKPQAALLRQRIDQPGDPLRTRLAGELTSGVLSLLARAEKEGGTCYAALYELDDVELLQALLRAPRLKLILANTGPDDGTNQAARQTLHDARKDVIDRMLKPGHIGHNKFMVYVDKRGVPRAVLSGSTNWTSTGLCGQTNNAIIIENTTLARQYLATWRALADDQAAQDPALRQANRAGQPALKLPRKQGMLRAWFSPNTEQQTKPSKNPGLPVDLAEIYGLIQGAQSGVLFLVFQPGAPSILNEIKRVYTARAQAGQNLFVRGAATDVGAAQSFNVDLFHRTPTADASVIAASALQDQFAFWQRELLTLGRAVIHDKILVIDPFGPNCAVVTGSHNLGYQASYANDENLLILRGNSPVTQAYAAHVLDIYDHFRWRWTLQQAAASRAPGSAWIGLAGTDAWQNKYFDPNNLASADDAFWA